MALCNVFYSQTSHKRPPEMRRFSGPLIWLGSISRNVSLRVGCNLAKFHAFIIKVNNSLYFWSIRAGLGPGSLMRIDPQGTFPRGGPDTTVIVPLGYIMMFYNTQCYILICVRTTCTEACTEKPLTIVFRLF